MAAAARNSQARTALLGCTLLFQRGTAHACIDYAHCRRVAVRSRLLEDQSPGQPDSACGPDGSAGDTAARSTATERQHHAAARRPDDASGSANSAAAPAAVGHRLHYGDATARRSVRCALIAAKIGRSKHSSCRSAKATLRGLRAARFFCARGLGFRSRRAPGLVWSVIRPSPRTPRLSNVCGSGC